MIESPVRDLNMAEMVTDQHRSPTEAVYLQDLWSVLVLRKRTVGKIILSVLVVALAFAYLLPVEYTSTASFIPPSSSEASSMASALAGQLASLGGGELLSGGKTAGDLYAGILRSRSVSTEIIKRLDLMNTFKVKKLSEAEKQLASSTAIVADPKSTIVTINVTARSPELAHNIASSYLDALRNTDGRLALTESSQRRLFYSQQLAREKDDLENAEVELKKLEEQSGLIAPTGQTAAQIKAIADAQAEIAARQVGLAALRQSATDANPDVVRLRSEVAGLQNQLSRMLRGGSQDANAVIPAAKVPELQLQYVRAQREVKYHEALFEMLAKQFETARLQEAREGPMVQILDAASFPDSKSSPKRLIIMLLGLVLGTAAAMTWVLWPHLRPAGR